MRHNQYIVKIPTKTLMEALNLSDNIVSITPVGHQNEHGNLIFMVNSKTTLKTIKGKMVSTTTLDEIAKKKPGRPPKKKGK